MRAYDNGVSCHGHGDFRLFEYGFRGTPIAHGKSERRKPDAARCVRRRDAIEVAKRRGRYDLNIAAFGLDGDPARHRFTRACTSEGGKKAFMLARSRGDQSDARDSGRRIGMDLERRIPEILRVTVQAGEESCLRRLRVYGKSQCERDLNCGAVRALGFAFELAKFEIADSATAKLIGVGSTTTGKHEHRRSLLVRQKIAIEGAE